MIANKSLNFNGPSLGLSLLNKIRSWPRGQKAPCLLSSACSLSAEQVSWLVQYNAKTLCRLGVSRGDVILVATGRGHRFWLDLMALWLVGAIAVPLEPSPAPSRLATVLQRSLPQWLLGSVNGLEDGTLPLIPDNLDLCDCNAPPDMPWTIDAVKLNETAIILFTSGTTGEPKGVALSHAAILGNATATQQVARLSAADTLAAAIPFRFVSAISHFVVGILSGATYAGTEESLTPDGFIQYLLDVGCNAYGGSPLQARWIAEWLDAAPKSQQTPLTKLRWVMSSGDYFSEDVGRRLTIDLPGCVLIVAYGLTEAAGRMCYRIVGPLETREKSGAVGYTIEGLEVEVFDEWMQRCPHDEPGRIFVRGDYVFSRYANDPEKTARSFTQGWFETGDVGYKNGDGMLFLHGRTDDVFKMAGVKVSTPLIADALLTTGEFVDVAVISRSHVTFGNVPHVFYVLAAALEFDHGKVMRYLRDRLPTSHLPWGFTQVEQIPRNGSGKIDRRALRQQTETLLEGNMPQLSVRPETY